MIYELRLRKLKVESQKPLPIFYKDVMLDCGYRLDLVVEDLVIVEIKSDSDTDSKNHHVCIDSFLLIAKR